MQAADRIPARIRPNPATLLSRPTDSVWDSPPKSGRGNNRDQLRSDVRAFVAEPLQTSGKTESSRHPARIPKVARCISTKVDRAADIQPPTTWAQRINRPLPARPTRAGSQKVAGGRAQRPPRVTPPTTTAPRRRCQKAWVNRNDATDKSTQSGVRRSRRLLLRSRQRRGAGTPGSHTHLAMTSMRDERSPASTKPNRG